MDIAVIVAISYLIITTVIILLYSRYQSRNQNMRSFYLTSDGLGPIMIMALIYSEVVAAAQVVGAATEGFTTGLYSVWNNWGQALGIILFLLITAKFCRATGRVRGSVTLASVLGEVMGFRGKLAITLVSTLTYMMFFASGPAALGGLFAPLLGIKSSTFIWILGIAYIVMGTFVGMKGLAIFNLINTTLIFGSVAITCFSSVSLAGGLSHIQAVLPASYFNVFQPDALTAVAGGLGTALAAIAGPIYASTTLAAKSKRDNVIGQGAVCVLLVIFSFMISFVGIAAKVIMPDAGAQGIIYSMGSYVSPLVGTLILTASLASSFSSGPSLLFLSSMTLTKDCYGHFHPNMEDKRERMIFRIIAITLGLVFIFMATTISSVFKFVLGAFQIRSVIGIALALYIFWPRVSETSFFWSIIIGGIVAAGWFFGDSPLGVAPLWAGGAVTCIVCVILTLSSKEGPISVSRQAYNGILEEYRQLEADKKA